MMESSLATASNVIGLYLIRVGYEQNVIPTQAGSVTLQRGDAIVCRTARGLEIAHVLTATQPGYVETDIHAKFVRKARPEDLLLWKRLNELSLEASVACRTWLEDHHSIDVLLEVEPLLDGKTLYFHFLGSPSNETELQMQTLAELYHQNVSASKFAVLLEHGCGPGCGTKDKSGCGTSGGCAVCSMAGKCVKS